ncbi:MAG: hypothetical protein OHK0039_14580 [Bacteroidia bacterium]
MGLKFSLFGIPTEIKATFLLLGFFFSGWVANPLGAIELMVWAFLAILLHELGHAWAYRRYGIQPWIELYMLGGLTYASAAAAEDLSNGQRIFVSFAGPLMSLAMGAVIAIYYYIAGAMPAVFLEPREAIAYPLFFSIGWGVLNLLPILPLDGGNILRYLLAFNPRWNALRIAATIGIVLGAVLLVVLLYDRQFWNAMLVGFLIFTNVQHLRSGSGTGERSSRVDQMMQHLRQGDSDTALQLALDILQNRRNKADRGLAMQVVSHIYLQRQDMQAARQFASDYPDYATQVPELRLALLVEQGAYEEATTFARDTYALRPDPAIGQMYIELLVLQQQHDALDAFLRLIQGREGAGELALHTAQLLLRRGAYDRALAISQTLFERDKNAVPAMLAAEGLARLGRAAEARQWIERAIAAGQRDLSAVRRSPGFEAVRDLPDFLVWIEAQEQKLR